MSKLYRKGRLRTLWDFASTSLWFVPVLMMLGGVALAVAGLAVDLMLSASPDITTPWWIYVASTDDARDVISTLLSSMITMTTFVFSVTMVVLTLAAQQFGPRLVRNFMASRLTQFVLGTFVMTIVYCLLVLPTVGWRDSSGQLPFFGLSIAVVLTLLSVFLLVVFIHNLALSIISETVIERVGRELDQAVRELDPLPPNPRSAPAPEDALPHGFEQRAAYFGPEDAGYIQVFQVEQLVAIAQECELVIGFHFRPGDYVAEDGQGIAVCPSERFNDDVGHRINAAISIGPHRTPVQDPEFPVRHLVEIAVRALSPGINDPYTAVAVLHRLSASLAKLMGRQLPQAVFRDDDGKVRVVCPRPTYAGMISGAIDQIRQNGADKPLVVIHILEALIRIAPHTTLMEQVAALRQQLDDVTEAAERRIAGTSDQKAIRSRVEKAGMALQRAETRIVEGR